MKAFVSSLLAITLLIGSGTADFIGISRQNTYADGCFTDVAQEDWFSENVASVYEYGLMVGTDARQFSPHNTITVAEAVTISARLHKLYAEGNDNFVPSTPWYASYVDYAYWGAYLYADSSAYYAALEGNEPITRNSFILLLSFSLPDSALEEINTIEFGAILDLWSYLGYDHIYQFYRAGILNGKDSPETFAPTEYLTRCESAAIVSRIVEPSLRIRFTLTSRTFDRSVWYGSGTYQVGVDVPRGLYYVIPEDDKTAGWSVSRNDSSGAERTISSNSGIEQYDFITVHTNEFFTVTNGRFVLAEQIPPIEPIDGRYGDGKYRIGVDVPAGTCQIHANDQLAVYYIFTGARGHGQGGLLDTSTVIDFYLWDSGYREVVLTEGNILCLDDAYVLAPS